jgi:glycosyltransferase involved in cell wall biosynthesis
MRIDRDQQLTPLVSCLCLTRNRLEWLKKAVACYEAQTYAPRELVIIADAEPDVLGCRLPASARVFFAGPINVGRKRNFGCRLAAGDLVAHWDDDDYSAPQRLADQVRHLVESGAAVTGYHTMKFTDGSRWWRYSVPAPTGFAIATSLCYRRSFWREHPFEEWQCGQDEAFVNAAAREKQLSSQPDLDLMYATVHPGNTSPRFVTDTGTPQYARLKDFQWAS